MIKSIEPIKEATKTSRWRKRLQALRTEQTYFRPHWTDIVDNMLPRRGRYLRGEDMIQDNDGRKKAQKIINGRAQLALHTFAAGMQSGTTSPSRPWFTLSLPDEELAEHGPVREWLHSVQQAILRVLSISNYYSSHHYGFYELGAFGTFAMIIEEDEETVIRCRPLTIGEYCLGQDSRYRPNALFRQFMMTASQMRDKFCSAGDPYAVDEDTLPVAVRNALAANNPDMRFQVVHVIEESQDMQHGAMGALGMTFKSAYFPLQGDDQNCILREHGYNGKPFIASRWNVNGVDTYGESPGMDALGDVKMLYKMELDGLKALDKMVDPPMVGPTSLKMTGGTIVSGGVTYIDAQQGQQGFSPAYMVKPEIQQLEAKIERVEQRINEYYGVNLFMAITQMEGQDKTAFEIARRHEERLIQLGPALERLQQEDLDPTIERVYTILDKMNLLPPPPADLPPHTPIKIQYVSVLAQAQKMVGMQPIEQTLALVQQVGELFPEVKNKINIFEVVNQYTQMNGTPPKIIRDDKEAEALTQQQMKQQQAAQMAEMAKSAGPVGSAVKNLATAPAGDNSNVLAQMMPKTKAA